MKGLIAMYSPNLICICVNERRGKDYSGMLWHQYQDGPVPFSTAVTMIEEMDWLYDQWKFPQRSTQIRAFESAGHMAAHEEVMSGMDENRVLHKAGNLGTFIVRVKFRQNATWQGEVVWAEKQERKYFRSALELLKLIDGALDESSQAPPGADPEEPLTAP